MTTSETIATTTSGWALISLPTMLVFTLILTLISVLAVTSLKQRLSSSGLKLPSLKSITTGHHHTSVSSAENSTESQASIEQLTLEQLMNQAMRQMTQVMTSTVGDDSNIIGTAAGSEAPLHQHQRQHTKQQQLLMTKINKTLPPNWEVGVTVHGRIYYIDHLNQQTTWDHPLLHNVADWRQFMRQGQLHWDSLLQYIASLPQPDSQPPDHESSHRPPVPEPASIVEKESDVDELPMPPFWEKAVTKEGIPYYVNHLTRRTSWVDPRTSKPSVQSTQSVYLLKKYREEVWAELKKQAASSQPALNTLALTTSDSDSNLIAGLSQMPHQGSDGSLASSTVSALMPLGGASHLKSNTSTSAPRATRTSSFSSVVLTSPQSDTSGAKPRRFSAFASLQQQFSQTVPTEPFSGLFSNSSRDSGSRAMNNV